MTATQKSECPMGVGQVAEGSTENASILPERIGDSKVLANLKASLAMSGHAVHDLANGGYLVVATKWAGMCRECPDLRSLTAFARQIGATA